MPEEKLWKETPGALRLEIRNGDNVVQEGRNKVMIYSLSVEDTGYYKWSSETRERSEPVCCWGFLAV